MNAEMNRRGLLKSLLAAPMAAKGTIEQVGDRLFSGGHPISEKAIEIGGIERGCGNFPSTVGVEIPWSTRMRQAVVWVRKNKVPPYLQRQAVASFNRNPTIPPDIACLRSVAPGSKFRMARERFIGGAVREWERDIAIEEEKAKLPEFMRDLWI